MTDERMAEIEARANAATPGPWEQSSYSCPGEVCVNDRDCVVVRTWTNQHSKDPEGQRRAQASDTHFIAHARTDVPDLVAEVERLEARVADLELVNAPLYGDRIANLEAELARERQRAEAAEEDNQIFRRLLWIAHSQGRGYGDDGEMQDCTKVPIIDFKRDSASVIKSKIVARNLAAMKEADHAR